MVFGEFRGVRAEIEPQTSVKADVVAVADTQFALARALAAHGRNGQRARSLAESARETYANHDEPARQREVDAWLAARRGQRTR